MIQGVKATMISNDVCRMKDRKGRKGRDRGEVLEVEMIDRVGSGRTLNKKGEKREKTRTWRKRGMLKKRNRKE